jgi:hypothetical protein
MRLLTDLMDVTNHRPDDWSTPSFHPRIQACRSYVNCPTRVSRSVALADEGGLAPQSSKTGW